MPLYDFKCPQCGKEVDLFQSFKAPMPACPVCGCEMEKQVTKPGGFEFKGGGYYATDFKNKN